MALLISSPFVTVVGFVLVHFLWQGAVVGAITAIALKAMPRATARLRYGVAGAGLIAMMCAPLVTLGVVWQAAPAAISDAATVVGTASIEAAGATSASPTVFATLLPAFVLAWAVGVFMLTVRLVAAWWRAECVRRREVHPSSDALTRTLRRLAVTLGIRRRVALLESAWVDVPTVVGWMRPTILLPIGAFIGLSVQQVEAVLSHELAHIKRHDYVVNVIQNLAETVLFFHPAVWWVSHQIRVEREHCCDDVAVDACGNAVMYARALATLEEARVRQATFALAATDGSLATRVRRILGEPSASRADRRRPVWPIALSVAGLLAVAALSGEPGQPQINPDAAHVTPVSAPRIVLPAGSTLSIPPGDLETLRVEGDVTPTSPDIGGRQEATTTSSAVERVAAQAAPPVVEATRSAPQAPARTPVRVGGDIREPRKLRDIHPVYPEAARAAGISGVVILEAVIDPEGIPVNLTVLRSIPDLDQAAINAVRQWRYTPSLLNGVPVAVMMTVTVNFTLEASASSLQALQARYSTLLTQLDELTRTPDQLESQRRTLQVQLTMLERQIALARAELSGRPPAIGARDAVPTPNGVARVGGGIAEPKKIRDVRPVYPNDAQVAKVSGVVIMEVTVDADGNVTNPRILRSIPMLDQAALDAVSQWKYTPTLINGVATAVIMTVTINFQLG